MSTRGVVIIRRDGIEKAMDIWSDAYPSGAGVDIADLIKTTDMEALFDALTEYDEWEIPEDGEEEYPDDPDAFSFERCRMAVKHGTKMWITPGTVGKIRDSLFCEYAYLIDLDKQELLFFSGGQTQPQEGNPYGTQGIRHPGMKVAYYPCRLTARFLFRYIWSVKSGHIAHEMELAEKDEKICIFCEEVRSEVLAGENDHNDEVSQISECLCRLSKKMETLIKPLSDSRPTSINRLRGVSKALSVLNNAVNDLEKQIDIII